MEGKGICEIECRRSGQAGPGKILGRSRGALDPLFIRPQSISTAACTLLNPSIFLTGSPNTCAADSHRAPFNAVCRDEPRSASEAEYLQLLLPLQGNAPITPPIGTQFCFDQAIGVAAAAAVNFAGWYVAGDVKASEASVLVSNPRAAPRPVSPEVLDIISGASRPAEKDQVPVYGFHVYAHKHNTHITVTKPDKGPLPGLSLSAGNLGFRKANRGTYDAAYQLGSYVIGRMVERGHLNEIKKIEVVLRGFGVGREAVTKVILGQEGERIRRLVSRVTDATRLKFGGTRSEKPRRLG